MDKVVSQYLTERKESLIKRIKSIEKAISKAQKVDDEVMQMYSDLNVLKWKLKSITDRIKPKNISIGIEPKHIRIEE